jgi:hypothetical protein
MASSKGCEPSLLQPSLRNRTLSYFADRVQVTNVLVGINKPWCEKNAEVSG